MIINRDKTVAFSGHRELAGAPQGSLFCGLPSGGDDLRESLCRKLKEIIHNLYQQGYTTFLCGMADGFDILSGEAVCDMQAEYPEIELVAVIPHPGQAQNFDLQTMERYEYLLANSVSAITLSKYYRPDCFHIRNDFLVDNSSVLVCFFNGSKGGTAYTVKQAIRKGIKVINTY